jgi:hypothetical protein
MTDTQTEPTEYSFETTTPSGTHVEITVRYGSIIVYVTDSNINTHAASITTKRGTTVLDLGRHGGDNIYVPIDDDLADDIHDAVDDTEDESAGDFMSEEQREAGENGDCWYDGKASTDGQHVPDDGHVAADNQ